MKVVVLSKIIFVIEEEEDKVVEVPEIKAPASPVI